MSAQDSQVKILVADDDPVSRRLIQRTLENSGYEVVVVVNGKEAVIELTKPDGPRLALIDWMMPELDSTVFVARCAADTTICISTFFFLLRSGRM